jgi:acetolactate synthase-1/3 small subunit
MFTKRLCQSIRKRPLCLLPTRLLSGHSLSERTKKTAQEAVNNILYDTNQLTQQPSRRILSCLVNNEPGVLSKISGALAGRGFNIDSLVVSQTEVEDLSRMTISLQGEKSVVEQARKQLEDLVPVWAVLDYTDVPVLERELLMVRVGLDGDSIVVRDGRRNALVELTRLFNGRVLDLTGRSITMEICAKPSRVDAFLELCRPYGIAEAARSGMIALPRAPVAVKHAVKDDEQSIDRRQTVDATLLPPG